MKAPEIRGAGDAPDGWTFDGALAAWCGRADADASAPRLRFGWEHEEFARAARDGDASAIASLVTQAAMPAGLLLALAERCLDGGREAALAIACGRKRVDLRWARALAERALAAGLVGVEDAPAAVEPLLEGDFADAKVLPDGSLVALDRRSVDDKWLARVRRNGETLLETEVGEKDPLALLVSGDPALARFERGEKRVTLWSLGSVAGTVHFSMEALPEAFHRAGDRWWVHTRTEHLCRTSDEKPVRPVARAQPAVLAPMRIIDGWLLTFGHASVRGGHAYCEELRWVKLDGSDEDRTHPWYQDARHAFVADGRVWIVTGRGVWGLHPLEPPRFRWAIGPQVAAVDGERLWFSWHNPARRENGVDCVDFPTSGEHWRHVLPERPGRVERIPGGVVTAGQSWWWIADDGRIVESGRGFLALTLAQAGTTRVFSTGDELIFVGAGGELVRRVALESRAALLGSTGEHVVATTPTTLHVFDATGRRVATAPRTREHGELLGPGAIYVREPGKLSRVTVRDANDGRPSVLAAPARLATVQGERVHHTVEEKSSRGPVTYTEPGLALAHSWHVGSGNTYVGDPEEDVPSIDISDGAIVTLIDCTLEGPLELRRAATLVLINCTEKTATSIVEDTCFVIRV
jgi:hypothetical protein